MRFLYHHRTRGIGVEAVHIRGIVGGLEALGHAVTLVSPPGVEVDRGDDIIAPRHTLASGKAPWRRRVLDFFVERCPGALFELLEAGYSLAALPRLLSTARRVRPDAIYERYAFFNAGGLLAARALGIPLVVEVNDTVEVERQRQGHGLRLKSLARATEDRVLAGAAVVCVVSGYLRDQLVARGIAPEKILVTPNAIDADRFDPVAAAAPGVREQFGLAGRVVIGFVGSFASWHGTELLIDALPPVLARYPEAAVLLVGDGVRRPAADARVREMGLSDRVRFAGHVPHARVAEYLAAMDIGVMPHSNPFGSPVKIFEYMAMGLVPVGPRFGPLQEAFDDGVTGVHFSPGEREELVAALDGLLADPARRQALGAAARQRVLDRHTWVHNAREIEEALLRRCPRLQRTSAGALPTRPAASEGGA